MIVLIKPADKGTALSFLSGLYKVFPTEPCQLPDTKTILSFLLSDDEILKAFVTASDPVLQNIIFLKAGKHFLINFENSLACELDEKNRKFFCKYFFKLSTKI